MTLWQQDDLIEHRRARGWPDLREDQVDQLIAIVNDALSSLNGLDYVSWIEPAIQFRSAHHD